MERQRVQVDPAVAAVLQDGNRRTQRREMTEAQRRKAAQDAKRQRVTFELDPQVVKMITQIAAAEQCSPAGVVNLLVCEGVQRYVAGSLVFDGHRQVSGSPKWGWVVMIEGLEELVRELQKHVKK